MQPVRPLVRIQHGSHLYGTNTAASDTDIKGVHLPSGEDIILMRKTANIIDRTMKLSASVKNTSIDTDDTSYSLQKWLMMLTSGDTVASEILFAPDHAIIEMDPLWPDVRTAAIKTINRRVEGFVSYCQRQAAKYGVKGSRMATIEALIALFDRALEVTPALADARLSVMQRALEDFCVSHDFASIDQILVKDVDVPHLNVLDRKFPFTVRVKEAYKVYRTVYENFGARALAAKNNEGIDWKAVSHAIRVAGQAIELLNTGNVTFPRPNAAYLLEVKQGLHDFAEVSVVLESLVQELEVTSDKSDLPDETDQSAIDDIVLAFHRLQVIDAI